MSRKELVIGLVSMALVVAVGVKYWGWLEGFALLGAIHLLMPYGPRKDGAS